MNVSVPVLTRACLRTGRAGALGFLLALAVVTIAVPKLAGGSTYAVLTGSMRPALPEGSLAVVRPVDPARLGVGDVVTYQLRSGEPATVSHRVVEVARGPRGLLLRMQGDANGAPDRAWVRPEQVRGTLWYSVPYVGHVTTAVPPPVRAVLTWVAAVALLAYAGWMFLSAAAARGAARPGRPVRALDLTRPPGRATLGSLRHG